MELGEGGDEIMAHCLLWYKQFKKDPGFCGLSKATQKAIGLYLDFIQELTEMGLDEDSALTYFPSGAFQLSGLRSLRPDSEIRKNAISKIFDSISNNKKVTGRLVREITGIASWNEETIDKNCSLIENKFNGFHKGTLVSLLKRSKQNKSNRVNGRQTKIAERISFLYQLNTSGQTNILENMNTAGYGEDVYGAYCIALKWASERLEAEKAAKETAQ